jgi:multiple sugar transport system substrate-binding protein
MLNFVMPNKGKESTMGRKINILIALVAVASLLLSGCAAPAAQPAVVPTTAPAAPAATSAPAAAAPTTAAAAAPTTAAAAAPTTAAAASPTTAPAAGAESAPVKLSLWHQEQPPYRVQRFQELIDAFNKANPGITVSQEPQNWGDVYTKAPAAIAAGNAPDLLFTIPDFTTIIKATGVAQPVDDFVKQMDQAHKFLPAAVAPYQYEGHTWAVPMWNMSLNLWYHKSMFQTAGVQVPTNWDEWVAASQKLTANGAYGLGLPANKQLYTDQTTYAMMANGGASEIYNADGTLRFDNPQTAAAFDEYQKLWKFSPPDNAGWTWGEAEACFDAKTCASILQFTVISGYDKAGGDPNDLGVAAVPHAVDQKQSATIAYPNAVMVLTKDKAKQDAAYKFLSYLLEPANYGRFLNMEPGLYLPVTDDGGKADSYWNDPVVTKYKAQVQVMLQNSQNGMLFGFTGGHTFSSIGQISAQNLIAQSLQKMLIDKMSPKDAAAWGQQAMSETIKK